MTPDTSRHDAYCAFMRRHRSTVWRVCWRFARRGRGNRDDRKARAEDLAQEVWIVLWLKFDQLDLSASEARQRRWLEKLTETVILDLHRRQEPELEPLTDELADTLATSGKKIRKKDLGMIAKSYGYVYVAQVAMGASQAQYFNVIKEAEAYHGPSLIICYASTNASAES